MNVNTPAANSRYDSSAVSEIVESFVESTANLAESLDAPEERVNDFKKSGEELGHLVEKVATESTEAHKKAQENTAELSEQGATAAKDRAEIKKRVTAVEAETNDETPRVEEGENTIQRGDLTPIEQLSESDDISEVTDSPSVERAISLFQNLPKWGTKTPKGIVLKPADNPLSLLEADRDESLAWKQYYRAAETLEQLSHGSVTFFDSDRHGKMVCLHEQSEAYQRVVHGSLSVSSVEETA